MSIRGRRIHIAGSAAPDADGELLRGAHDMVRQLVGSIIDAGAGLVVGTGDEPLGENGMASVFDWTALEAVAEKPDDPAPDWPSERPGRVRVVASQRALEKIPEWRRELWTKVSARRDFELETSPPGWKMGGEIRRLQVARGDVLIVVGGGAGTEQLAEMYIDEGKPVVPIRAPIGSIVGDGRGGSNFLQDRALSEVNTFFSLQDGAGGAGARLPGLKISSAENSGALADAVVSLLNDLRPPRAFYVRLLDESDPSFAQVERFFREVVDPVIAEKRFTPHEIGRDRPLAAFINVEIFEALHRAGLVVVDLTGVRPNCMMELGYALARRRRVLVSAMKGTLLPFDPDKLPTCFWEPNRENGELIDQYRNWYERNVDLPPIVM